MGPVYLFHGDVSPLRRRVTFATAQKSPKSRSGGGVFRFPPPPENPHPAPTNQGGLGPPIGCIPRGRGRRTGDEGQREKRNHVGRGRFSWRLTVPTPFVPLGHFPLTGGIGLGRRRGRGRARRVVVPHANDHCYLSCRAPEGRRVKDAVPYRFASFGTRRTTGEQPGRRV